MLFIVQRNTGADPDFVWHYIRVEKHSPGTSAVAVSDSANVTNTTLTCLEWSSATNSQCTSVFISISDSNGTPCATCSRQKAWDKL